MKRNKRGTVLIAAGLLLLIAALGLTGYNLWEQDRAARSAAHVMTQLEAVIPEPGAAELPGDRTPDYLLAPEMEMPTVHVDGAEHGDSAGGNYIGYLTVPALDLRLPVMSQWSYPLLKQSPCRYSGSAYTKDLVICAHNYQRHFGQLGKLRVGDAVSFTDVDGNVFSYTVAELEQLASDEARQMLSGDWALSLFTCTTGGRFRLTVRCEAAE